MTVGEGDLRARESRLLALGQPAGMRLGATSGTTFLVLSGHNLGFSSEGPVDGVDFVPVPVFLFVESKAVSSNPVSLKLVPALGLAGSLELTIQNWDSESHVLEVSSELNQWRRSAKQPETNGRLRLFMDEKQRFFRARRL